MKSSDINKGEIVYCGNISGVQELYGSCITISFSCDVELQKEDLWCAQEVQRNENEYKIQINKSEDSYNKMISGLFRKYPIRNFITKEPTLEDVFRNFYTGVKVEKE